MEIPEEIKSVTRLEVIGEGGRMLVLHNVRVKLSYQDEFRTLKVFTERREELATPYPSLFVR